MLSASCWSYVRSFRSKLRPHSARCTSARAQARTTVIDPLRTVEPRRRMLSQGCKADVRRIRNAPYSTLCKTQSWSPVSLVVAPLDLGHAQHRNVARPDSLVAPIALARQKHGAVGAGRASRSSRAGRKTFAPACGHSPAAASRPSCRGSGSGFGEFIELVQLALKRSSIR